MPKDFFLTDIEKDTICGCKQDEKFICSIAKQIFMSRTEVSKYTKNHYLHVVKKKRPSRPPKIPNPDWRRLLRELLKTQFCSIILQQSHYFKTNCNCCMTPQISCIRTEKSFLRSDKRLRVEWLKSKVTWTEVNWKHMIFSDEKKVNLDRSDSSHYNWYDLRTEEKLFSK